jgi:nucleoside-diphosphate-sugar epimerase
VTGCSGYLGGVLVKALLEHPLVERVAGLDVKAPPPPAGPAAAKFRFHAADIRDEFLLRSIMQEEAIDTVYHLAFMMGEPRDEALARAINLGGTLTVLDAASKCAGVRKLILSGSASAYGARRGNPPRLTESDALRADSLRYGVHKRLMEEELQKALPHVRKSLQVTVLRICTIVGGSERGEGPVQMFCDLPLAFSVLFHEGALQFISERDLLRVMLKVMEVPECRGVYNVSSDDYTTIAEIARRLGKPRLPVPYSLLWLAMFLARRLDKTSPLTENVVSYLAYPVVLANDKIKKALGVAFPQGSLDAFLECARSRTTGGSPSGKETADLVR